MFITGGRAGQIMFFLAIAILIFQFFSKNKLLASVVFLIVSSSIFYFAYETSNIFETRVNNTVKNLFIYNEDKGTSIGLRITWAINSFELIKNNPILGVGTGDFPNEYKKIHHKISPQVADTTNPHNMYLLVAVQLGLVGLVSFLAIFYIQIKTYIKSNDKLLRDFGKALPLMFLLIMFSDSYLLGHYTTLLYIFFSSFLYKDFERY